jgi:16S rRNA (guanine966-N2)-methyltransferase
MKLRILGGRFRSRKIPLPRKTVRPTKSIVRQRIFDIIMHRSKKPESFFDGFAGSGVMGLEAMSRDIPKVYFLDEDRKVIQHIEKFALLFQQDNQLFRTIKASITMIPKGRLVDVVFLDPPYHRATLLKGSLNRLSKQGWINKDTLIIFETTTETPIYFVEKFLKVSRHFSVGNSAVFFGHYPVSPEKLTTN